MTGGGAAFAKHIAAANTDAAARRWDAAPVDPAASGHFRLLPLGTFATRESVIRPGFADEALFAVSGAGPARIVIVDLRAGRNDHVRVVDAPSGSATPLAGSLATGAVLFQAESGRRLQLP